jgi:hypothetical protein
MYPSVYPLVWISIPGSHSIWQLRKYGVPLISERHSKHVPMPQKGVRGSPVTEVRETAPEMRMATAAVAPTSTTTDFPFTRTVTLSGMRT